VRDNYNDPSAIDGEKGMHMDASRIFRKSSARSPSPSSPNRSPSNAETGAQLTALLAICVPLALAPTALQAQDEAAPSASREDWIPLFNGRNLDGWTPKITGHEYGENFANTFRVEDGLIKVRYDGYERFDGRFGVLFYEEPFAYYRLAIEYRFVGEQIPGNPGDWALRNSGVMIHSQAGATMLRDQDFPISIEAQLLGGLSDGKPRPTMNMCSPGTEIVYEGRIYPEHCLSSRSKTYDAEQWVRAELVVLGGAQITHYVDGQKVLEYALPQIGGGAVDNFDPKQFRAGELLESGHIALQSESHPIDFRKVELLNLVGCMDPQATNYKRYFVKSDPASCRYANQPAMLASR
jgi:hypothetical protein